MDAVPTKFAARPDPQEDAKRPQIVAGAVAAKLRKDNPVVEIEPGSAFDGAMRDKLARFERGVR